MDAKVEHLKLIQGTISRLAGNSFLLRGWTVTLVAALFAFGAKEADRVFVVIAWVPLLVFAGLDAYYVMQERRYRDLYNAVAAKPETGIDYSMDTTPFQKDRTWRRALICVASTPCCAPWRPRRDQGLSVHRFGKAVPGPGRDPRRGRRMGR